jgi:hypothetical protein
VVYGASHRAGQLRENGPSRPSYNGPSPAANRKEGNLNKSVNRSEAIRTLLL